MRKHTDFTALPTAARDRRDNFKTLVSCVVPRPIAFVSTISADGVTNLAPFSFFNAVCAKPPAVMFAPAIQADGRPKDTTANIRAVGEFVINVVPHEIREAMNQTAQAFPPEVSEFEAAGFTPLASQMVRPPRVAESPVQMECKLLQLVPIGEGPLSTEICIGEVVCFHVAEGYLLPDETVDVEKIDLIARLGGPDYATMRERFSMEKPKPAR